ncbi:MAG: gamma-glutamyltransferase [Chloroflexi bacterium]|nr:gamma-glutamyltransferase [Chloroflexota bacterium]
MKTLKRILKWIGILFLGFALLAGAVYALLPKGPRDLMPYQDLTQVPKTMVAGESYAVVTGTPWATQAAVEMLERGGNAYDAAVAALLTLNATLGVHASFASIAPTMVYDAATGLPRSYIGVGTAPSGATLEAFQKRGFETVPPADIWSQLIPASPDVMIALLQEHGTLSFSDVSEPAIRVARQGFPATKVLLADLQNFSIIERLGLCAIMPYNGEVWMQKEWWRPFHLHDRMAFPDLANTFEEMGAAEQAVLNAGGTRQAGLQAVRDLFYRGTIAEKILALHREKGGLFTRQDLATYSGAWEQPVSGSYGEFTFYTNGGWTQGMVGPLALQILEGIDLKAMGHNSPRYVHTVAQAIELAQADRDAYVGDPAFVDVPMDTLMSKAYAVQRRQSMTAGAFGPLPAPGSIEGYSIPAQSLNDPRGAPSWAGLLPELDLRIGNDTTQLAILDRWGNAVVMTPSDFPWTPMVPGTGINLGNRMNQFRLEANSPDVVAPGKRPRVTPHAMIVFKDGQFYMVFSTPGGDMQPQALIQVFLNREVFGMDVQEAISAPRFYTISAPSSFAPHEASPGTLRLEADLYDSARAGLRQLGYTLVRDVNWDMDYGGVGAIVKGDDGLIYAGADPRWETQAAAK